MSPDANILVIDDGSPDRTADRADDLARTIGNVQVVRRERKDGLGAAYRAGLRLAIEGGADICVQMDADLSHDPASLPALVAVVEHGADVAIGYRSRASEAEAVAASARALGRRALTVAGDLADPAAFDGHVRRASRSARPVDERRPGDDQIAHRVPATAGRNVRICPFLPAVRR